MLLLPWTQRICNQSGPERDQWGSKGKGCLAKGHVTSLPNSLSAEGIRRVCERALKPRNHQTKRTCMASIALLKYAAHRSSRCHAEPAAAGEASLWKYG